MKIKITPPSRKIKNFMLLPSSKSISNRALIIQALCKQKFKLKNLSESDDTRVLISALQNLEQQDTVNVGAAGTAMRFLTAYLSMIKGERTLTGSDRMKQRPIFPLVNILRELGANIGYTEKDGYPPLKIKGKNLVSKPVKIKGNISSQYISALLMISPYFNQDFKLTIEDKILSGDYIQMTIALMQYFGVNVLWNDNEIIVKKGNYQPKELIVEADWSSASYWFEIVTLTKGATIELTGLDKNSMQGDAVLPELFKSLGVNSVFTNFGIQIKNIPATSNYFEYDFTNCPDLAQTLAVTLVAKEIPFKLTGLDNLSIKETDRIQALITELGKLGISIRHDNNYTMSWDGDEQIRVPEKHFVETYKDHRMALAFAPLVIITDELMINDPKVVTKSYPNYWENLEEVGFNTEYITR